MFARESSNNSKENPAIAYPASECWKRFDFGALYNFGIALWDYVPHTRAPAGRYKTITVGRFAVPSPRIITADSRICRDLDTWYNRIRDMRGIIGAGMDPVHERLDGVLVLPAWYC